MSKKKVKTSTATPSENYKSKIFLQDAEIDLQKFNKVFFMKVLKNAKNSALAYSVQNKKRELIDWSEEACRLCGEDFTRCDFTDCDFSGVDFGAVLIRSCREGIFEVCRDFSKSKFSATTNLNRARFQNANFSNCKFMGKMKIKNATFLNCNFTDCDFTNVVFEECVFLGSKNLPTSGCSFVSCVASDGSVLNVK